MTTLFGRLGAADLSATTNTGIYTCPTDKRATVVVSLCERAGTNIKFRLALIDGDIGDISNEDYFEYDQTLYSNGSYRETGIAINEEQTVMAYSDTANVSVVIWGVEEDI